MKLNIKKVFLLENYEVKIFNKVIFRALRCFFFGLTLRRLKTNKLLSGWPPKRYKMGSLMIKMKFKIHTLLLLVLVISGHVAAQSKAESRQKRDVMLEMIIKDSLRRGVYSDQVVSKESITEADLYHVFYVPPKYPRRGQERGKAGCLVVSFDVNQRGETENIKVIESEVPSYFNKPAINSVAQFLYIPLAIEGKLVTIKDVEYQICWGIEK